MSYEAVLLDFDDTLYAYPPCNAAGKRGAYEEFRAIGYDLSREEFDELYELGRRETKHQLSGTAPAHERYLYFKRALRYHTGTSRSVDALRLGDAYWRHYVEGMALFDGVEATLAAFDEVGVDVAIVTNLTTRIQLEKLRVLDIDEYIDLVVTSEEIGREKPGAAMFATPLTELDRRPSEAVMVGNSVRNDVEGGNAVGLDTVLFNADPDRELAGHERPDHRIEEFAALQEVVL